LVLSAIDVWAGIEQNTVHGVIDHGADVSMPAFELEDIRCDTI